MIAVSGIYPADAETRSAQSTSIPLYVPSRVPKPASQVRDQSSLSNYCKRYILTGQQFIEMSEAVINHGDLTDIHFLEKMTGRSFGSPNKYARFFQPKGQTWHYRVENVLNTQIAADLYIDKIPHLPSQEIPPRKIPVASLEFNSDTSHGVLASEFILNCLRMPASQISASVGGGGQREVFTDGVSNYVLAGVGTRSGKNDTIIFLNLVVDGQSGLVSSVTFVQSPR